MPEINWLTIASFPELKNLDPEETGHTFEANAQLKAIAYGEVAGILTLAEDSGLEVAALGGEPGVRSARWAVGRDEDRYNTLLTKMVGEKNRAARYVSVFCLYDPQTKEKHFFKGQVTGQIIDEPRGKAGFGYDPVFVPDGEEKTFAELDETDQKHQHSHRSRSLAEFKSWWHNR